MRRLAEGRERLLKLGSRDLSVAIARGATGGTTVSATCELAAAAGIRVFATGGIGGVHRGVAEHLDISQDLWALARFPVAVVCAGAKSVLDLPKTMEALETAAVPVIGVGTGELPSFYSRSSGLPLEHRVDDAAAAARILRARFDTLGQGGRPLHGASARGDVAAARRGGAAHRLGAGRGGLAGHPRQGGDALPALGDGPPYQRQDVARQPRAAHPQRPLRGAARRRLRAGLQGLSPLATWSHARPLARQSTHLLALAASEPLRMRLSSTFVRDPSRVEWFGGQPNGEELHPADSAPVATPSRFLDDWSPRWGSRVRGTPVFARWAQDGGSGTAAHPGGRR